MATGTTGNPYNLPYPTAADQVNVHGDIASLVTTLDDVLPGLGLSYFKYEVKNNSGSTIPAGYPVYATGYDTKTTIAKALPSTTSPILGLVKAEILNGNDGVVIVAGVMTGINTSSFSAGDILYVATGGGLTNTRPTGGSGAVGVVAYTDSTNGVIVVEAKGNGTWGALKNGLA